MSELADSSPVGLWEALTEEARTIKWLREHPAEGHPSEADAGSQDASPQQRGDPAPQNSPRETCAELHASRLTAICFSGGGIRSATFGLGILQGLARRSYQKNSAPCLLAEFDYLSTVSGGGFIGSWLSSWIYREGVKNVIRQLATPAEEKLNPEPAPIRHLRSYSNYLTPKLGLTSADSWTLAATVTRNILLNWLVLLPLICAVLAIPRITLAIVEYGPLLQQTSWAWGLLIFASIAGGVWAFAYVVVDVPSAGDFRLAQSRFLWNCMLPIVLASICITLARAWALQTDFFPILPVGYYCLSAAAVLLAGSIVGLTISRQTGRSIGKKWVATALTCVILAGAAGGWLIWLIDVRLPHLLSLASQRTYTLLAFPSVFVVLFLSLALLVGVTSKITDDEDREWFARAGGWSLVPPIGWLLFGGIVLFGPQLLFSQKTLHLIDGGIAILSGVIASRLGFSAKSGADRVRGAAHDSRINRLLLPGLLLVFVLSTVISLAVLNAIVVAHLPGWITDAGHLLGSWQAGFLKIFGESDSKAFARSLGPIATEFLLASLALAISIAVSWTIDVNSFSLQGMYRSRLIRAYLGASRGADQRKPSLFSGFDPKDNLELHSLRQRPFHLVNMALNLVGGDNLAWQQRKASSFSANARYTGNCWVGYRDSRYYSDDVKGLTLGGAVTISGAAASPNMGYHSSPLLTVVMTLFNARLGTWLGNPGVAGRRTWYKGSPNSALWSFIDELLGRTNDHNRWVYLSDGGHFENLGLYEMVLRRCRRIVVVDASADPQFTFGDLGNAIRKIRVDLGISIDFQRATLFDHRVRSSKRCAVAKIGYSQVDTGAQDGELIYIKPLVTGSESSDVLQYFRENPAFPHQTTADQWFDESQFESYRQLGVQTIDDLLGASNVPVNLEAFFTAIATNA